MARWKSSWRAPVLGGALVLVGIRLTIVFLRASARHTPSFVVDPGGSPEERMELLTK